MASGPLCIGTNGHAAAIDPGTGAELWRSKLGSGFLATGSEDVCVLDDEGRVFAGCFGGLFCLDAANGDILWKNDLKGLGHNDVTLSIAGKSIQFVATHTHTHS